MEITALAQTAEELLNHYREILLIDRFFSIKVELIDGDFASCCVRTKSPLSWNLKLNPSRHANDEDIQYSIIEGLLTILFDGLDTTDEAYVSTREGLIARLATAIAGMAEVNIGSVDE